MTVHVTEVPQAPGSFALDCTQCGEHVVYSGEWFTKIEAQRHAAWHARQKG